MKRLSLLLIGFLLATSGYATTTWHLHVASGTVAGYQSANKSQGTSMTTAVTGTTSGGTDIQVTATNGGSVIEFITPPLNGFTLSGTVTCNIWGLESSAQANATVRCRLYKYSGSEGSAILTASSVTELGTSAAVRNFTGTPTSTVFNNGDQLVIKMFITNVGTMGNGRTVTVDYDGATGAADGDTFVTINETVGLYDTPALANTLGLHDAVVVQTPIKTVAAADTLGLHCAVCFIENWDVLNGTVGIHDAVSVSVVNGNHPVTLANTFGASDSLQCCVTNPLSGITLGLSLALGEPRVLRPALSATLGLHDTVARPASKQFSVSSTIGLHDTLSKSFSKALPETLGITTSPFVAISHQTSVILTSTIALHQDFVAVKSKGVAIAGTFAAHDAVVAVHNSPRAVTATLGLHDVLAIPNTQPAALGQTLGLHLTISVVKNATTGRGMVVIT